MYKALLFFSLFILSLNTQAQTQHDLYLGVSASGGLANSPNSYFPSVIGYSDLGISATMMQSKNFGFITGLAVSTYLYNVGGDYHNPGGQQQLNYLKIPLGFQFFASKHDANVRFSLSGGLSAFVLLNARYTPNSYNAQKPTVADGTKENFHIVVPGAFLGCGMQIKLSQSFNMLLGAQSNISAGELNAKDVQGYSMNGNLQTFTLNIGLQYKVFSWIEKEKPASGYKRRTYQSDNF